MMHFEVLRNANKTDGTQLLTMLNRVLVTLDENNARDKVELTFNAGHASYALRARSTWFIEDAIWGGVFSAWKVEKDQDAVRVHLERGNSMVKNEVVGTWSGNVSAEQCIRSMLWENHNLKFKFDNLPPTQAVTDFKEFEPYLDRLDRVCEIYNVVYEVSNSMRGSNIDTLITFKRDRPRPVAVELFPRDVRRWGYTEDISSVYNRAAINYGNAGALTIHTNGRNEPDAIGAGVTKFVKESTTNEQVAKLNQKLAMDASYTNAVKISLTSRRRDLVINQPVSYWSEELGARLSGHVVSQRIEIGRNSYVVESEIK